MKKNKDKKIQMWKYLKKYKIAIFFYLFLYVIAGACSILITILSANTIEMITLKLYSKAIYTTLFNMGLFVLSRFCWWLVGLMYQKYSSKIMMDLNYDLARQAFRLNSKTYADHNTGTFVQRIVNDPQNMVGNLSDIVDSISDLITSIVIFVYIATLNVWISLLLFVLIGITTLIEWYRVRYRRKKRKILRKKSDKVQSLTTEIVKSEKDIKSIGLEEKLSDFSKNAYEDYRDFSYKINKNDIHMFNFRNLLINVGVLGIFVLGIFFIDKGLITLATYMILYSNRGSVYNVVWGFGRIGNMFTEVRIANERMFALFDEKEFVTEKFGNVSLPVLVGGGEIEFDKVGYTYVEFEYDKEKQEKTRKRKMKNEEIKIISKNHIFENLSFRIEPNTTVAFVGKSGSGKSTILNLMSKMYEVESGSILINGININDLTKESLRQTISLVNQFPYIFDMSIKENLLLAKKTASDEEIENALKDACLDEFVSTLPNGIETKVGESGIKLSGGQKQRLAIARALLRNSSIIIFDESTSSLDNFAQGHIKKSIDNLKGKATVVIVAHRLSTIKDVDKIFFLDEGKILDSGTFDELFERNEVFKTMFLAENI